MADLKRMAVDLLKDCAAKLKEYVRQEIPTSGTAPREWKDEIINSIDIENIVQSETSVTADVGLFYTQLYQRMRAGVLDQGMMEIPHHDPGRTVWNDDLSGLKTASDRAAYDIPQFYHSGTQFWQNAIRRLDTYFELSVMFMFENFDISKQMK